MIDDLDDSMTWPIEGAAEFHDEYLEYISQPPIRDTDDALKWWRNNESRLPRLACMARDILRIPGTGSAVERQFSGSGQVVNAAQNRLDPSTVRDVMIYKIHLASRGKPLHIRPLRMLEADREEGDNNIPEEWEEKYKSTRADLYKRLAGETTRNRDNEYEEDDID
jgi:hypothetical protein